MIRIKGGGRRTPYARGMTIAAPLPASETRAWLKAATAPHRRLIGLSGTLAVLDVLPAVGFAAGLALAIGGLAGAPEPIVPGLALAGLSLGARGLLSKAQIRTGARAASLVKRDARTGVLRGLFSGAGGEAGLTAAVEGVEALDGHVARFSALRTAAVVSPLVLIVVAALASPVAAGVMLFTLAAFVVGMALAGMAAAAESRRQFAALERLSGLFIDRVRALPAILAFGAERRATAEIAQASDELARRTAGVLRIAFLSSGVLEFFSALAVALVAVYCGFNLLRLLPFPAPEQLDLTRAFFVLALAPEVYAPMRRLAAAYHDRQQAEAAVPCLKAVARGEAAPRARLSLTAAPAIGLGGAAVGYGDRRVLGDLTLAVRPGETVAITGASGCGKTTLLRLLLGQADLLDGRLLVNGEPLVHAEALVPHVAWAGQTPFVLPGSLHDNIRLADRSAGLRRVMQAAADAGLHGDLDRGLDERGGGLSGGELRRLGLARAFLKRSPILLLDEPTANLDAVSEAALLPVIRRAAEGRTTLIATHSAAVAALADRRLAL